MTPFFMADEDIVNHSYTDSSTRTACFRCRGFRHACDRKKPACSTCDSRGLECVYPEAAPTLKELQVQVAKLVTRVQELENSNKACGFAGWPSRLMKYTALYPCQKCNQLQQPCDMRKPGCDRCRSHGVECSYNYNEKPKIYHISHAIAAMNNVIDAYESTLRQASLRTVTPTSPAIQSARKAIWTVTSTPHGFTAYAHISSYHELQMLINHIHDNQPMENHILYPSGVLTDRHITDSRPKSNNDDSNKAAPIAASHIKAARPDYLLAFALWNEWTFDPQSLPHDYPIDVTSDLTDDLLALYCRTPCCSAARLPIIDPKEFMARYRNPDVEKQPSKVLTYAICAMAARNAFQVHVWSKGPSHQSPRYNMGKALSVAYWLAARKLLAECFDEPSLDNCRSALLLSYASHQNGHTATMYYYDWIAITMAKELGLFETAHPDYYVKMLVWNLYYWNVWMRVLCGGTAHVICPKPSCLPPSPPIDTNDDYYDVLRAWSFSFRLQLQRASIMSCLASAQEQDMSLPEIVKLFQPMQTQLETFVQELPEEFKLPQTKPCKEQNHDDCHETTDIVDREKLRRTCAADIMVHYSINLIMLHYPFLPSSMDSSSAHAQHCFRVCMQAAQSITCAIETMTDCCCVPTIGLVFSNSVYHKVFQSTGQEWVLRRMQESIDVLKLGLQYVYDFDMTKTLVRTIENEIQVAMSSNCHKG